MRDVQAEHALAATMTYANSLRVGGSLSEARGLANDAVARYRRTFGDRHPLTLVAQVNAAQTDFASTVTGLTS